MLESCSNSSRIFQAFAESPDLPCTLPIKAFWSANIPGRAVHRAWHLGGRFFNGSAKTISAPGQSFYEKWSFSGVPKRFAQPLDRIINSVIEINECIGWPNLLAQVFARNDPARLCQQDPKNLKRLLLPADPDSVSAQFSSLMIEFVRPKPHDYI
jgi:hypothetical protein